MKRRAFFSILAKAAIAVAIAPAKLFMPAAPEPLRIGDWKAFDDTLNRIYGPIIHAQLSGKLNAYLAAEGVPANARGREVIYPIRYS